MTPTSRESLSRESRPEHDRLLCLLNAYEVYGGRTPWPECAERLTSDAERS